MLPWQHLTWLLTSIISMSNFTFIACVFSDLEKHMSPHYNVLPEAVCCCLLVNHVVCKHLTITTLLYSTVYTFTHIGPQPPFTTIGMRHIVKPL